MALLGAIVNPARRLEPILEALETKEMREYREDIELIRSVARLSRNEARKRLGLPPILELPANPINGLSHCIDIRKGE